MSPKTTLLLILDGWGKAPDDYPREKNAIAMARTPYWDKMLETWPNTLVQTSGRAVGLPDGIMGNSEVGHLNLGAGRTVWQGIMRIDVEIEKDGLAGNAVLCAATEKARDSGKQLHLMGLVSDGGVHSMDRHYFALLRLAKKLGVPSERVIFHAFLDGRDTPPRSGLGYVEVLEKTLRDEDLGRIAYVSGRYWAMDREQHWDRTQKAYDAMARGESEFSASSGADAVQKGYDRDENDEFIKPTLVRDASGKPIATIRSGDQVIFFNFRPDRARQLSHALCDAKFDSFRRDDSLRIDLTTMMHYEDGMNAAIAFPPENVTETLGEYVSGLGLKQLRIAEKTKFAHATYFFSGGREEEFPGESRIFVPSADVATFDLKPEMSLPEVADNLEPAIRSGEFDLIVCNFANGDMVGHTGIMEAAVQAAEAVDAALTRVIGAILETGGSAIVTADHGNCERMWNFEENCPDTQHSTAPTPCVLVDERYRAAKLREGGKLGDVSPTLLKLMGLPQPEAMTGQSLIEH
ncbi:2,3-bisphosphoglycerate-independent phosphoglycerate mutase [Candidatus Sumerlaeota bacterium]|nr:2,3-bisphosphoglycerate-independent phosphoglycerate mutase [Candidatus Sumerlaeota bacterium]